MDTSRCALTTLGDLSQAMPITNFPVAIAECNHQEMKHYSAPIACLTKGVKLNAKYRKCGQCGARWFRVNEHDPWTSCPPLPKPGAAPPPAPAQPDPRSVTQTVRRGAEAKPKPRPRPELSPTRYQFDNAVRHSMSSPARAAPNPNPELFRGDAALRAQLQQAQERLHAAEAATFQRSAEAEDWQTRFQEEAQIWRTQQQGVMTAEAQQWQQRQFAEMREMMLQQAHVQGAVPAWQPPMAPELDPAFAYGEQLQPPADEEDDVDVELDFHLPESPSRR